MVEIINKFESILKKIRAKNILVQNLNESNNVTIFFEYSSIKFSLIIDKFDYDENNLHLHKALFKVDQIMGYEKTIDNFYSSYDFNEQIDVMLDWLEIMPYEFIHYNELKKLIIKWTSVYNEFKYSIPNQIFENLEKDRIFCF